MTQAGAVRTRLWDLTYRCCQRQTPYLWVPAAWCASLGWEVLCFVFVFVLVYDPFILFLQIYFIDYQLPHFPPLIPSALHPSIHPYSTPLSSCPWVIHVSSLASPFPILFLASPSLFSTYYLCFLFPVTSPPFSSFPLPADNPPCDLCL